jgi:transposase
MGQLPQVHSELFYDFCLARHVPDNHMWRQIDAVLHLGALREHLASHYRTTGRPSADPELMIRMLLMGYCSASARSGDCVSRSI